jgi:uncharacterized protein with GYD domain
MPLYLTRFSYTPATWAKLIKHPEDRRTAAKQYIEAVGGKLQGFWYAFGDHDAYALYEAPDNVSMAANAMAISAGGALSSLQTTVLLTVEDCQSAFKFDPVPASNFDPFERRVLTVALASSELAGIAETWRARAA